jgi:hypothetical protein
LYQDADEVLTSSGGNSDIVRAPVSVSLGPVALIRDINSSEDLTTKLVAGVV